LSQIRGIFADTYDRFVRRESLLPEGLSRLIASTGAKDILEMGVGTGSVAVGLRLEGYDITGVDRSRDMLRQAASKTKKHSVKLRLVEDNIVTVDLNRQFDLTLCLGNTLPLVTGLRDSRKLFENCARHLKPGGFLIIQNLNYDRIMDSRPATFAVDLLDDLIRIKQYRYGHPLIEFVISLIDTAVIPPKITVSRNRLRPWTKKALSNELKAAGFSKIRAYGDYRKNRFRQNSKDLVIICQR